MKASLTMALGAFVLVVAQSVAAQPYPNKPIRIIVPHPVGGATDAVSRGLATFLGPALGQSIVVDNRPGASGIIGAEACAKAPPDGYTLCVTNNDTVILNPLLYSKLPYDPDRDLIPVVNMGEISGIVIAHPSVPSNTVAELVAQGRKKPESVRWGTFGAGSVVHVYADWLSNTAGAAFLAVHYKGAGPAIQAVLAGEVDATLFAVGPAVPQVKAGKVKALAILGSKRSPLLPEVPTFTEQGFQYYITTWLGLFAPSGTPREVLQKLNAEIVKVARDPKFKESVLDGQTIEFTPGSPEDFANYIRKDRGNVEQIVRASRVRMD